MNGLYYDSETPKGVKDWRTLPTYVREGDKLSLRDMHVMDEEEFYAHWSYIGLNGMSKHSLGQHLSKLRENLA